MEIRNLSKIGRNDSCPCGSGKKYKKCCLPKEAKGKAETELTSNPLSNLKYKITDEPLINQDMIALPDEVQAQIESLYNKLHIYPESCIKELEVLVKQYPQIPAFYNYLYAAYINTEQVEKGHRVLKENYKKNPDYLFAKLNYAEYLMSPFCFDTETVENVLGNNFDLALLYPERDVFHISEVLSFYGIVGFYYVTDGQIGKAQYCLDILKALSPRHDYTVRLIKEINSYTKFIA